MSTSRDNPREADLTRRVAELEAESQRLRDLLGLDREDRAVEVQRWEPTLFNEAPPTATCRISQHSSAEEKVRLFRSVFRGRDDVFARRWENTRTGKAGWSPARATGTTGHNPDRDLLPLTDDVVAEHLAGHLHLGLYPLLRDDTCRQLVCDFDGSAWLLDALAYLDAAREAGIPAALERSRSGEGGHVWIGFSDRVSAASARRIGVFLLREAMTVRGEMDLSSYDRLFPSQDFLPKQGFGNLIALPLQGACRKRGTTVFLDPSTLEPYSDQWAFLASWERLSRQAAVALAESLGEVVAGPDARTFRPPSGRSAPPPVPASIRASAAAMLVVDRIGLPPPLLAAFKHAASLPNPDFYEKERNRFWTGNTPRFIRCYQETLDQLLLPRGVRVRAEAIAKEAGSELQITDAFPVTPEIDLKLGADLRSDQMAAVDALASHRLGVLVAPPGAGKTVIGCALIARHRTSTLVIVDRQHLVEQWRDRLSTHLGLGKEEVGQLGGQRKPSGVVDVAMAQSLARRDDLASVTQGYGLVVVDECHHVPAVTFERAVRQIPSPRWVGLTATPYRRDGLQAMMTMYCGPIRHRMAEPPEGQLLHRQLVVHETVHPGVPGDHIQETFRGLVVDTSRTRRICDDISMSVAEGRNSLVLTRWTEHLDSILTDLTDRGLRPLTLRGGMGKKATRAAVDQLAEPGLSGAVLLATASFLGEGFDCPALDTVFLAFPIRFKGAIVQYVGRILRPTPTKSRVIVHDYVDVQVPVLARMFAERVRAYASLGFQTPAARTLRSDG